MWYLSKIIPRELKKFIPLYFSFYLVCICFFVLLFYASLTNATSNVSVVEFVKGKSKRKNKK